MDVFRPRLGHWVCATLLSLLVMPLTLSAADYPQVVVIVRHAERAEAPAGDVALSPAGEARADELVSVLAEARVDTVITTQFRRTRDTAVPVARQFGVTTKVVDAGRDTAAHVRAIVAAIREGGRSVLVVGHSNTVPAIIAALGGPPMEDLCDTEYSNLFTLALVPGQPTRLVHGRYGAPDPPSATDCHRITRQ